MLGTKTKHVVAYGRRGHRIINVSDEGGNKDPGTTAASIRESNSQSHGRRHYDDPSPPSSPGSAGFASPKFTVKTSRKMAKVNKLAQIRRHGQVASARKPLSAVSANILSAPTGPNSPVVSLAAHKKPRPRNVSGKGTPLRSTVSLKPISPVVNVEIIVLDDDGRQVNVEKRTTRPAALAVPVKRATRLSKQNAPAPRGKSPVDAIVLSSDEDELPPVPRTRKSVLVRKRIIVSSSDEDSDVEIAAVSQKPSLSPSLPEPPRQRHRKERDVILSPASSSESTPSTSRIHDPTQSPPRRTKAAKATRPPVECQAQPRSKPTEFMKGRSSISQPLHNVTHLAPPAFTKPRPLTPIRSRATFPAAPPSPTFESDLDESLSFDFAELALSPKTLRDMQAVGLTWDSPKQPAHLRPLLEECGQDTPHEFSAFIEMFPFDQIAWTSHDGVDIQTVANDGTRTRPAFRKIGEASYSEVFGIGDVVLKIIPLRNEEAMQNGKPLVEDLECPSPSDAKDVLKEVIVTRAMGQTCAGFTELLRAYVVRGRYPSLLLDLWDDFHERKGSESVRPDGFAVSQVYAIIVLPNGGPDLESYTFATSSKVGWRQACSLFWQVTRALAQAEDLVEFEHRDLHWGQILVKNVTPSAESFRRSKTKLPMDSEVHGIQATIIDLGLSRMNSESDGGAVHWTPFDAETFEGEGDYQFDVYRMMKVHNADSWEEYRPLTNVMWLHYLLDKLIHSKRLRKPIAPKNKVVKESSPPTFSELECWQCLTETEAVLRDAIDDVKRAATSKKGRRKTQAVAKSTSNVPSCADDVMKLAYERGWLSE